MLNIRKRQIRRYLAALLSAAMVISNTAPAFAEVDPAATTAQEAVVETEASVQEDTKIIASGSDATKEKAESTSGNSTAKTDTAEENTSASDVVTIMEKDLFEGIELKDGLVLGAEGTLQVSRNGDVIDPDEATMSNAVSVDLQSSGAVAAKTGETLKARVLAFNDNPNTEARTRVRIYADTQEEGGTHGSSGHVVPTTENEFELKISEGGSATTVTAAWSENKDYLEFELPSGASTSFEIGFTTDSGYDGLVKTTLYAEYCVMDDEGNEGDWQPADYTTTDGEPFVLTWDGSLLWGGLTKTPDITSVGYSRESGFFPNSITWKVNAQNYKGGDVGILYTEYLDIKDTLKLPEGYTFPQDMYLNDDGTGFAVLDETGEEKPVWQLNLADGLDYEVVSFATASDAEAAFELKIRNPEETLTDVSWNPLTGSNVSETLYLSGIRAREDAKAEGVFFRNEVELNVSSVQGDQDATGDTTKRKVLGPMNAASSVKIEKADGFVLNKEIISIVDENDSVVWRKGSHPDSALPQAANNIKNKYHIGYRITVTNRDSFANAVEFSDTYPGSLRLNLETNKTGFVVRKSNVGPILEEETDYTRTATTEENGDIKQTFHVNNVEGGQSVTVEYTLDVDYSLLKPEDALEDGRFEFKNVASLAGGTPVEKTIRTAKPELPKVSKKLIRRTTTNDLGSKATYTYYTDAWNGSVEEVTYRLNGYEGDWYYNGDGGAAGQAYLKDLFHQVAAGDYIEYLIEVKNESPVNYYGSVTDFQPFRNDIGTKVGDWEYYICGDNTHYFRGRSNSSAETVSDSGHYSDAMKRHDMYGANPEFYQPHDDLVKNARTSSIWSSSPESGIDFFFDEDHPLKPGQTLRQSVVLRVPGDYAKSMEDDVNREFKVLQRAAESKLEGLENRDRDHPVRSAELEAFVEAKFGLDKNRVNVTGLETGAPILHLPSRLYYLNTGVLAKAVVNDPAAISDGEVRNYYADTESGVNDWKTLDVSNHKTFLMDPGTVLVNYIYLYNDSPRALDLNHFSPIVVNLPEGFSWLGLAKPGASGEDSHGKYVTYSAPFDQVNAKDYAVLTEGTGAAVKAVHPSTRASIPYDADAGTFTWKRGTSSYSQIEIQGTGKIAPYKGILLAYAARIAEDFAAKYAHSMAGGYMPTGTFEAAFSGAAEMGRPRQISADVLVTGNYAEKEGDARFGLDNHGKSCGRLSPVDQNERDMSYYGYDSGGSRIYSSVTLNPKNESIYVYVKKDAYLNNGRDDQTPLSELRTYEGGDGQKYWFGEYDDYFYKYILHDGIHRTVDGSVTWNMVIYNAGNGIGEKAFGNFSYGTLIDTIDSPYKLQEIFAGSLPFLVTDSAGGQTSRNVNNVCVELPQEDSGWKKISDDVSVFAWNYKEEKEADPAVAEPFSIRVTRILKKNGSLGWGFDAVSPDENEGSDGNTDAYQYVIEIASWTDEEGNTWEPILQTSETSAPKDESSGTGSSNGFGMSLTFHTTDAIETNYNSFAVAMPGRDASNIVIEGNALVSKVGDTHHLNDSGISAGTAAGGRMLFGATQVSASWPTGGSSATLAGDTVIVEYSDWTDTSYTDGEKTISLMNADGTEAVSTITTRQNGDMVLPKLASSGDKVHGKLMVESVLYEAEEYDSLKDLVIYDLYGTQEDLIDEETGHSAYDVDLSSIKVYDSEDNKYTEGVDYRIEYTTEDLVTMEHHPIQPVNTLFFAADIDNMMADKLWTAYNGTKPEEMPVGFRIVFLGDKAQILKAAGNFKVYVEYDSTVLDVTERGKVYPNVLAWTVAVHDTSTGYWKGFREDTTAAKIRVNGSEDITLRKTILNHNGMDVSDEYKDELFKFAIIRFAAKINSDPSSTLYLEPYRYPIDGVAYAELTPGGDGNLTNHLKVLYGSEEELQDRASFLKKTGHSYVIAELPSENFTIDSLSGYKKYTYINNGKETIGSNPLTVYNSPFLKKQGAVKDKISTEYAEVRNLFGSEDSIPWVSYYNDSDSRRRFIDLYAVNRPQTGNVNIKKIDEETREIIGLPVSFTLSNDRGTVLFVKDSDGNYRAADKDELKSASEVITFTGNVKVTGLTVGTYTLTETDPPTGYLAAEPQTIKVNTGEPLEISVADKPDSSAPNGVITLTKTDGEKTIASDTARFEVYADANGGRPSEGAEPLTFVTSLDEQGQPVEGGYTYSASTGVELVTEVETVGGKLELTLPAGRTYYLVETKAPGGYKKAYDTLENALEVKLNRTTLKAAITAVNKYISGTLKLTKKDAATDSAILKNPAVFTLLDSDGTPVKMASNGSGMYTWSENGQITELQTKSDGTLTVAGLPEGRYTIRETEAPKGYTIDTADTYLMVDDSRIYDIAVTDTEMPAKLRIAKWWATQGGTGKEFSFEGVNFRLFEENADQTAAELVGAGITDPDGMLEIEGLSQQKTYYLVEDVPENYAAGDSVVTVYVDDGTGNIDLTRKTAEEGYTKAEAIKFKMTDSVEDLTEENGTWVFNKDVHNIRQSVYGGVYASVAYKTISNEDAMTAYGIDTSESGYSYYYRDSDYNSGNYNYVNAVAPGDEVNYTLNVANVSDYEFEKVVLIDYMPEPGDHGVVNIKEMRDSEFTVLNKEDDTFEITVGGKKVDPEMYTVTYSDKTGFSENDFNNISVWDDAPSETTKSFRIAFSEEFMLAPDQKLQVSYKGKIADDAVVGAIAWNNFAYRYCVRKNDAKPVLRSLLPSLNALLSKAVSVNDGYYVLTPEPPKVGVRIIPVEAEIKVKKSFVSTASNAEPEKFSFVLQNVSEADKGTVTYQTEDGSDADFPKDGISQEITVDAGGEKEFTFPKLSFSRSGIYEFDVTEATPADAEKVSEGIWRSGNVLYDVRPVHVTVDTTKIKASGEDRSVEYAEAIPVYQKAGEDAESSIAEFTNKYVSPGEVTFRGTKKIEGRDLKKDDVFTFTVEETTAGVSQPFRAEVKNKADGTIPYPTITYTVDDAGTHTYKVKETAKNEKGIACAENAYDVTVKVELDPDNGTLTVTSSDNYTALNFVNTYEAKGTVTFEGTKRFENEALKSGQFTFTVREGDAETGTVVATGSNAEAAAGEKAKITFTYAEDFGYTLDDVGKTYTYYLSEDIPEGAAKNADGDYEKDGVIYDGHSAEVTVTDITDKGDGTITAKVTYPDADNSFANRRPEKTSVSVKKVWRNATSSTQPASVTIHLLADGKDTGKTLTLSEKNGWSGSFGGLDVKSDGKVIAYTVTEDAVSGYSVSIEKGSDGYSFTVTNTKNNDHHGGGGGGGGGRKPRIPETTPPAPEIPGSGITVPEVIGALPKTGAALGSLLGLIGILCACLFGFRKKKEDEDEEK